MHGHNNDDRHWLIPIAHFEHFLLVLMRAKKQTLFKSLWKLKILTHPNTWPQDYIFFMLNSTEHEI